MLNNGRVYGKLSNQISCKVKNSCLIYTITQIIYDT